MNRTNVTRLITIAAWVAYPTAVLAIAGLGAGGAMLALDGAP